MSETATDKQKYRHTPVSASIAWGFAFLCAWPLRKPGDDFMFTTGHALGLYVIGYTIPLLARLGYAITKKRLPSRVYSGLHIASLALMAILFWLPSRAESTAADNLLNAFPGMSTQAKSMFRQRTSDMSQEKTTALLWQLMSEGETLMSDAEKNEMTAFYWKAVETLTPEEQMFVQKVHLKMGAGQGYSAADQQKSSALVQRGFGNLSEKDNARYLEMRGKAIELALLKPDEALRQFKSTYPPSTSSVTEMTAEQKQKRMQEIMAKAISLLPEKDRVRFLELHLTPADQLTKAQYEERTKYSEQIMSLLSEDEMREMMELTADMLGNQ